jgi:hypothetical protein
VSVGETSLSLRGQDEEGEKSFDRLRMNGFAEREFGEERYVHPEPVPWDSLAVPKVVLTTHPSAVCL